MERYKIFVAVYMILIKDNKILLGRRANSSWMNGRYNMPAGHLEEGETLVEAVIRETKEEVGIDVLPKDIEHVHTMHRKGRYVDIFFKAKVWQGDGYIAEPDKCDDLQWFPLDNLPENPIPSQKSALDLILKGVTFSEFNPEEDK